MNAPETFAAQLNTCVSQDAAGGALRPVQLGGIKPDERCYQ